MSVEAKVDESFGETIGTYWMKAKQSTTPTRAPERIQALLSMAFGPAAHPDAAPWQGLRYQLLTAVTGTAIEASRRQSATAIVVVHEFRTENLDDENVAVNHEDFQNFVSVLVGQPSTKITEGRLYGPAVLTAGAHLKAPIDVFIGKAVFDWHQPPPPANPPPERTG
jgi:hypothetical protein